MEEVATLLRNYRYMISFMMVRMNVFHVSDTIILFLVSSNKSRKKERIRRSFFRIFSVFFHSFYADFVGFCRQFSIDENCQLIADLLTFQYHHWILSVSPSRFSCLFFFPWFQIDHSCVESFVFYFYRCHSVIISLCISFRFHSFIRSTNRWIRRINHQSNFLDSSSSWFELHQLIYFGFFCFRWI